MKKNISLLITLLIVFLGSPPAESASPYPPLIRPGIIGSDGENGTDFFVDLFLPFMGNEKALIFLAPNLRIDDTHSEESNIGMGLRLLGDNTIFGLNAYYDTIKTSNNKHYEQWAFGMEALSKGVDFRFNYYHPIGKRKELVGPLDTYRFGSTSILIAGDTEVTLEGYDVEIGMLLPFISDWFETRAHVGGYRYDSDILADISNIKGVKYRIESKPNRLINLIFEITNDALAGTDTYYGGYLDLPFSLEELLSFRNPFKIGDKQWRFAEGTRPLKERMTDKVVRDRYVRTIEVSADDLSASECIKCIKYISNAYPNGINIIYVNADTPIDGSGTYDTPYKDINSAVTDPRYIDGTWIYVFSSDNAADTYNNVHITLKSNSILWGQNYRHPVLNLGGGEAPILDGGGSGDVITLANNNEVMGLAIQNGYIGIYGPNIKLANIHDNTIMDNSAGVSIHSYFSGADFLNDSVYYRFADNHTSNNLWGGIKTNVEFRATNSISLVNIITEFTGNTTDGMSADNYVKAPSISETSITNTFLENNFTNNKLIDWGYMASSYNEIYAYAQSGADGSGGFSVGVADSSITNTFTDNTVTANNDTGAYFNNSIKAFTNNGNRIYGNVTASVDSSHISNYFADNDISNHNGYSLKSYNYISGSGRSAWKSIDGNFSLSVTDSSITNVFTSNKTNNNSGGDGVYLENELMAFATLYSVVIGSLTMSVESSNIYNTFSENTSSSNNGYGFEIYNSMRADTQICTWKCGWPAAIGSITSSGINNVFTDNTADNNLGGIYLYDNTAASFTMNNSTANTLMSGNTITNNDGYGAQLEYYGNGAHTADLGGGTLGSTGKNSFYGNPWYDLSAFTGLATTVESNWWNPWYDMSAYIGTAINAENNWWGGDWDPDLNGQIELGAGSIDYTPWLTVEP